MAVGRFLRQSSARSVHLTKLNKKTTSEIVFSTSKVVFSTSEKNFSTSEVDFADVLSPNVLFCLSLRHQDVAVKGRDNFKLGLLDLCSPSPVRWAAFVCFSGIGPDFPFPISTTLGVAPFPLTHIILESKEGTLQRNV